MKTVCKSRSINKEDKKMKSIRKFTITFLVMVTCFFLVACGKEKDSSDSTVAQKSTDSKDNTKKEEDKVAEVTKAAEATKVAEDNEDAEDVEDYSVGDVGETEDYHRTKGFWRLDGVEDTASIAMDGYGGFECYYGSGVLEFSGYLEYNGDVDRYEMYDVSGTFIKDFYFHSETQINLGNEDETIYLKSEEEVQEGSDYQIPALVGGAMFTGMEPLVTENYADGGYYCSEKTEDGMTVIINTAKSNSIEEGESIEDYISRCAYDLSEEVLLDITITLDEGYSDKFTYPVYLVSWFTGENKETRRWEMFFFMTDTHTYMYSFNSNVDNAKDMLDVWMETFDGLYME
jgi:hypothetical protein